MSERKILTTADGCPIADNKTSLTAGERGLLVMQDVQILERVAHQPQASPGQ